VNTIQKTYSTGAVSKIVGIHPNTVRLYENMGLITKPIRKENGYRIFTDLHISQFQLARRAFQIEVMQNGLRKKAVDIVKTTALCDFDKALKLTREYILKTEKEIENADEAISIVQGIMAKVSVQNIRILNRNEVSRYLGITIDALHNWEMNGLLKIKRKKNGYRFYMDEDIRKLKIIRTLRCANYSLSSILRMMNALEKDSSADIEKLLNTPSKDDEIISACDKLVVSLRSAQNNALTIEDILLKMKKEYSNPPL